MSELGGEKTVIVSAVVVGGTYAYLAFTGQSKTPPQTFIVSFGVVFVVVSLVASASPGLGAGLALLVMASDLLANAPSLADAIKAAQLPGSLGQDVKAAPGAKPLPGGVVPNIPVVGPIASQMGHKP